MRQLLNIGLILALVAGIGFAAADKEENPMAASFTLPDVEGNDITLDSLLEVGPVYMECWDLPCVNCIAELDALMPIYDTLKERGLQIIALSVDKPADEARVKAFVKSKGGMTSAEAIYALNEKVARLLEDAVARTKANKRATVKPQDL